MQNPALYLRTIVFGAIDSIVSTVGLLAGIAVAGSTQQNLLATGLIYAIVEAFSMGVGNFLSEESVEEYAKRSDVSDGPSFKAAIVMFVTFIVAALVPLAPYFLYPPMTALAVSIVLSVCALYLVGLVSARVARLPVFWRAARMALLGGGAIAIGVLVGLFSPFK